MAYIPEQALAIAGGAIASALIDTLVQRNILSREDAMSLLATAQKRCIDTGAPDAARLVGELYAQFLQSNR